MTAPVPDSLVQKIGKLIDQKIQAFARSGFLKNASVSAGGVFTVLQGGVFMFMDALGNVLLAQDTTSGEGLANPWLPLPTPVVSATTGWPSTTAATWGTVAYSYAYQQHTKVYWLAQIGADAGVTGQVRLNINSGAVYSTVHTVTGGAFANVFEVVTLPAGFYGHIHVIAVEAQVTAGTGAVRAQTFGVYGRQS